MDHERQVQEIEAHGFSIMENAIDPALCDEIIAEIRWLEAVKEPSRKGNAFVGYKTVRYFDLLNEGEVAQPIHRDDELYAIAMPHRHLVCNTMWALEDFSEANGATRIVPDTHRRIETAEPAREYESIAALMPKGSVCFVLGTCYQGGGANRTNRRRWAITINYCAGMMRQQASLMLAVLREKARVFRGSCRT